MKTNRVEVYRNAATVLECLKEDILDRGYEGSAEAIMKYIGEEIKDYKRLGKFKEKKLKGSLSMVKGGASMDVEWEGDKIEELDTSFKQLSSMESAFGVLQILVDYKDKINEIIKEINRDPNRCPKCGEVTSGDEEGICANCAG